MPTTTESLSTDPAVKPPVKRKKTAGATENPTKAPRNYFKWDALQELILLEWLEDNDNYNSWKCSTKSINGTQRTSGLSKTNICKGILEYFKERGVEIRDENCIRNKIDALERSWRKGRDWLDSTGEGLTEDDDKLAVPTIKAKLEQICPYFDRLNMLCLDSPGNKPPYVADSLSLETEAECILFEEADAGIPGINNTSGNGAAEAIKTFASLDDTTKADATMELPNDCDATDSNIGMLSQKVGQPIRSQRFSSFKGKSGGRREKVPVQTDPLATLVQLRVVMQEDRKQREIELCEARQKEVEIRLSELELRRVEASNSREMKVMELEYRHKESQTELQFRREENEKKFQLQKHDQELRQQQLQLRLAEEENKKLALKLELAKMGVTA